MAEKIGLQLANGALEAEFASFVYFCFGVDIGTLLLGKVDAFDVLLFLSMGSVGGYRGWWLDNNWSLERHRSHWVVSIRAKRRTECVLTIEN